MFAFGFRISLTHQVDLDTEQVTFLATHNKFMILGFGFCRLHKAGGKHETFEHPSAKKSYAIYHSFAKIETEKFSTAGLSCDADAEGLI